MTRRIRPATADQEQSLDLAVAFLKEARKHLKAAGAVKTLERLRKTLTSAQGAQRHMSSRRWHTEKKPIGDPTLGSHLDMRDAIKGRSYR